jgi:hypothetical protein
MLSPKYTGVSCTLSFLDIPTDENLLLSVQDAWFMVVEKFPMIDIDSGILSVPIFTNNKEVMYIYTMTIKKGAELQPAYENWLGKD